jgi:DNA polymerase
VGAWKLLEEAATAAVAEPGAVTSAIGVKYVVRHSFLWCLLPSGRALAYGRPKMQETEAPWADKTLEPAKREKKMSLTVRGTDAQSEKWVRFPIYGGSLFNNVVQGSARDILVHGMFNAEAAGYPIVLHTHDEMAAELPYGQGSWQELAKIAERLPAWASDLPLTADGFESKRYRKD